MEPLSDNPELYEHPDENVVLGTDAVDSRSDESGLPPIAETDDSEPIADDR